MTRPSSARRTKNTRPSTARKTIGIYGMSQNLTTGIYESAIPAYRDAIDLASRLEQQAREARTTTPAAPGARTLAILDAARNGADVLDTAHNLIGKDKRQANASEAADAIFRAAQEAKRQVEQLMTTHLPDVVAEIRDRIEALGDELAAMRQPIPANADAAINANMVDDYRAATDLVKTWQALVVVYVTATRATLQPHHVRLIAAAGFCPDPLAQHPVFLDRRANIATGARFATATPKPLEPLIAWAHEKTSTGNFKPAISGGKAEPEGATPGAWVRHLAQHGPLTVHDPEVALRLWDLAEQITAPLDAQRPGDALTRHQALAEYHALLGDDEQAEHHQARAQELDRGRRHGGIMFA